jgi:cellulose synthase/poly-beta-1,6-N-acetylglucosamine synthase-like glycosyltransferase
LEIIFILSTFLLFYIYFGYPIVLVIFSVFSKDKKPSLNEKYRPKVSLIIAAYNEERVIEKKIKNSLALDYPKDKLEIIIFSDSSVDKTDEIVKQYKDSGIKLYRIEGRRGKTFCQNEVVKLAEGEILIFSDANSMYQTDVIKNMIPYFSNDNIGCVVGELRYENKKTDKKSKHVEGENIYWKYDKILKMLESKISSVVTANGSIYSIRKSVYVPLEANMNSDFIEVLRMIN